MEVRCRDFGSQNVMIMEQYTLDVACVDSIFRSQLKFVTGRLTNLEGSAVGNVGPIMNVRHICCLGPVKQIIPLERHYARLGRRICAAQISS